MLRDRDYERLINGENFVIATDFDGTLTEETEKFPAFGKKTSWFSTLVSLKENFPNVQVILFTCREGEALENAIKFCNDNGLFFDAVNEDVKSSLKWKAKSRKPFAHIYVDDRAGVISKCNNYFSYLNIHKKEREEVIEWAKRYI